MDCILSTARAVSPTLAGGGAAARLHLFINGHRPKTEQARDC
jgi:hypothetical protein